MGEQLILDLPVTTGFARDDFFVSDSNAQAVAMLERWPEWPLNKLLLSGPEGAGKSHLSHVWAAAAQAQVARARGLAGVDITAMAQTGAAIEDVPEASPEDQVALFHLHNLCAARGAPLLLTGRGPAAGWRLSLPDLVSRISAALEMRIGPPDDNLLHALLIKLFADRQLTVAPRVLRQLLLRMDRSFASAEYLVAKLDRLALQRGGAITPRLASEVLESMKDDD